MMYGLCSCSSWATREVGALLSTDCGVDSKEKLAVNTLFAAHYGVHGVILEAEMTATETATCGAPDCCDTISDESVKLITVYPLNSDGDMEDDTIEPKLKDLPKALKFALAAWVECEVLGGIDWDEN